MSIFASKNAAVILQPRRLQYCRVVSSRHVSSAPPSRKIARTLYRQLLRWCRATDSNIPLVSIIPPIHLQAPEQIDLVRFQALAKGDRVYTKEDDCTVQYAQSRLPRQTMYTSNGMTIPLHSIQDVSNVIHAVYRINSKELVDYNVEHQKQRITLAFEALKTLNELTTRIEVLQSRRQEHSNRDNVTFHIGQVVQHQHDRWRGVIVGWSRPTDLESSVTTSTSLTTKDYTPVIENVKYEVILDEGDAHMLGSSSGRYKSMQADLSVVRDESLVRIRNKELSKYFVRFDAAALCFVPNQQLRFEFPADTVIDKEISELSPEDAKIANDIVLGIQQLATRLERVILDETSCPDGRGLTILANVKSRLASIASGDVFPDVSHQLSSAVEPSPVSLASMHIRALLNLTLEIQDVMSRRRQTLKQKGLFRHKLGDIVVHKKYGFRGVVVGCDPRPTVDVTRWDGLEHIDNPMELPFYHVIPDEGDCIEAFGGKRSMRYVCEDNLEVCPSNRLLVNVDLNPDWTRSDTGRSYMPPADHRFRYGADMEDEGVSHRCMEQLEDEINSWQVLARKQHIDDPIVSKLSVANMLKLLQVVDTATDAVAVQELIKEMRKAHPSLQLRWKLEKGLTDLLNGNAPQALEEYQKVLAEDPGYCEAHNKLATCLFMMGRLEESLVSTKKALDREPDHFQALNGLGLLYFEKGNYHEAVEHFKQSTLIDPWSPVSAKLSVAVDLVNQAVQPSEIS